MSPVSQTNEWDDEKCQVRVQECLDLSTEPTLGNSLVSGDAISQTWPAGALLCANRSVQWRYESSIRRVPGASHRVHGSDGRGTPSVHARQLRYGAPGDAGRDRNCSYEELALFWQIYSRRCSLQIHFRQCGHWCSGGRMMSSRMA